MYDYSRVIFNAVNDFLESEEWHYSSDKERGSFYFALGLDGRISKVDYYVYVHRHQLISYAVCPLNVDINDSEQLAQMSEFLHRANYGLANGNFELDVRDGEIRYKSFVDWEGCATPPSTQVIRNSIIVPAMMFNRYNAGIIKIIFNGAKAKDVIDEVELPHRPRVPEEPDSSAFDPLSSLLRDEDMDPQVRNMLESMVKNIDADTVMPEDDAPDQRDGKHEGAHEATEPADDSSAEVRHDDGDVNDKDDTQGHTPHDE